MPVNQLEKSLDSDQKNGLTEAQVSRALEKYGPNELKKKKTRGPIKIFISQFNNFLVAILVIATMVSFYVGNVIDSAAIIAIVILNAVFGFVQEYKAEHALEALRKLTAARSTVIRGGKKVDIESSKVVPGDILDFEEGDRVPAASRIIEASSQQESAQSPTGESL